MKLSIASIVELVFWLFKVVMKIIAVEKTGFNSDMKHAEVKRYIMPMVNGKNLDISGEDVDKIINGLIWFIKKFVNKK